uniref:Phlebovirus glycoprotein G2 fusion domain-containing protein n=1 Tax=Panagrellus redivivus TaxID=6233 RepID=A0A7E4W7C8_PANRE
MDAHEVSSDQPSAACLPAGCQDTTGRWNGCVFYSQLVSFFFPFNRPEGDFEIEINVRSGRALWQSGGLVCRQPMGSAGMSEVTGKCVCMCTAPKCPQAGLFLSLATIVGGFKIALPIGLAGGE